MASRATKPAPTDVSAPKGSKLAGLHVLLDVLIPRLTALEAQVKELKASAVAEARNHAPGAESITVHTPGTAAPLWVTHSEPMRFDSKGFEVANPEAYAAWKRKGDQWAVGRAKA